MNGSMGSMGNAGARVRAAWLRAEGALGHGLVGTAGALLPPDLGPIIADLGSAGEEDAIDAMIADAEERWDRGLPAGLEHYRVTLGELARGVPVSRALLMCEVSRRASEHPDSLREELLTRYPDALREVEVVIGMIALISGAGEGDANERDPGSPLGAGTRLGKYELRERIGAGSFGEVWRAWDTELARHIALKVLHGPVWRTAPGGGPGTGTGGATRIIDEARAAASLQHPHIVSVHDAGVFEENGRCYIDSELVADPAPTPEDPTNVLVGTSLETLVRQGGVLDARSAAALLEPVCRAVAVAHARGVLHRDLKPSNILVSPAGRALVADFGLSVSALPGSNGDSDRGTGTVNIPTASGGRVVGTPAYMSPEQAHGEKCTPASDVYGLGVTLRFLLTGRPPYEPTGHHDAADGRWDVIKQARAGGLRPLTDSRPRTAPTLARIVDRACAGGAEDRYASADAFAADLRAFLSHHGTVADPPGIARAGTLWYRRNMAAATVGLTALCVLVAVTTRFVDRVTAQRDRAVEAEALAAGRLKEAEQARQIADAVNGYVEASVRNALATPSRGPATMNWVLTLIAQRLATETPPDPLVAAGVAHFLGQAYLGLGANDHAQKFAEQGLGVRRAALGELAPDTLRSRVLVARIEYREKGRENYEESLQLLIKDCEASLGERSPEACEAMRWLSRYRVWQGRHDEARDVADEALRRRRAALPAGHAEVAEWLTDAALPRRLSEDYTGALPLLEEAAQVRRERLGLKNYETLGSLSMVGQAYMSLEQWDRAIPPLREAVDGLRAVAGPTNGLTLATVLLLVRALHLGVNGPADALASGTPTMEALRAEGTPGTGPLELAGALGACLLDLGRVAESAELLEWAWAESKVRPGGLSRGARAAVLRVRLHRAAGEHDEANQLQAELDAAFPRNAPESQLPR